MFFFITQPAVLTGNEAPVAKGVFPSFSELVYSSPRDMTIDRE